MIPYIDTDFQTAIEKHIFGNLIIQNTKSPLIMGIFGPMGEGKTFQLEYVLRSLSVDIIPISPSELENADAGAPAQLLRDLYKRAGQATQPTALVINDIDTVLGRWGDLTQYTMNRQLVYGQLQNFCDEPCSVAGQKTRRIPIFITGNNPSILYKPLTRPGRMRIIEWMPSVEQKIKIVRQMFPKTQEKVIASIVRSNKELPVSFWNDVSSLLWEESCIRYLYGRYDYNSIIQILLRRGQIPFEDQSYTTAELGRAVKLLKNNIDSNNYLVNNSVY